MALPHPTAQPGVHRSMSDHEAERIVGGMSSVFEHQAGQASSWLRRGLQAREWQSFWSLFEILIRSAWESLRRAPGS